MAYPTRGVVSCIRVGAVLVMIMEKGSWWAAAAAGSISVVECRVADAADGTVSCGVSCRAAGASATGTEVVCSPAIKETDSLVASPDESAAASEPAAGTDPETSGGGADPHSGGAAETSTSTVEVEDSSVGATVGDSSDGTVPDEIRDDYEYFLRFLQAHGVERRPSLIRADEPDSLMPGEIFWTRPNAQVWPTGDATRIEKESVAVQGPERTKLTDEQIDALLTQFPILFQLFGLGPTSRELGWGGLLPTRVDALISEDRSVSVCAVCSCCCAFAREFSCWAWIALMALPTPLSIQGKIGDCEFGEMAGRLLKCVEPDEGEVFCRLLIALHIARWCCCSSPKKYVVDLSYIDAGTPSIAGVDLDEDEKKRLLMVQVLENPAKLQRLMPACWGVVPRDACLSRCCRICETFYPYVVLLCGSLHWWLPRCATRLQETCGWCTGSLFISSLTVEVGDESSTVNAIAECFTKFLNEETCVWPERGAVDDHCARLCGVLVAPCVCVTVAGCGLHGWTLKCLKWKIDKFHASNIEKMRAEGVGAVRGACPTRALKKRFRLAAEEWLAGKDHWNLRLDHRTLSEAADATTKDVEELVKLLHANWDSTEAGNGAAVVGGADKSATEATGDETCSWRTILLCGGLVLFGLILGAGLMCCSWSKGDESDAEAAGSAEGGVDGGAQKDEPARELGPVGAAVGNRVVTRSGAPSSCAQSSGPPASLSEPARPSVPGPTAADVAFFGSMGTSRDPQSMRAIEAHMEARFDDQVMATV